MERWRAVACAVALAAGCTGGGDVTICFCYQDLEPGFWAAAHTVMTASLRARGVTVIERNANNDANRQLEQVRDAIAQGVDGIVMIPHDGDSAAIIIEAANRAGVPIGVFGRPPATEVHPAIVVLADTRAIAQKAVAYMVEEAAAKTGKSTPCIMIGDLADLDSIACLHGFTDALEARRDLFNRAVEVVTKGDANAARANLESALGENPGVDFLFLASDALYPQVRAALEPLGKWKKRGEDGHVILGGLDGDATACRHMREGYVDATGVRDLFFEADAVVAALLQAIEKGEKKPKKWIDDPGFAVTQANIEQRGNDMWGCKLEGER